MWLFYDASIVVHKYIFTPVLCSFNFPFFYANKRTEMFRIKHYALFITHMVDTSATLIYELSLPY